VKSLLFKEQLNKMFGANEKTDIIRQIPIERIDPNPFQPRAFFSEEKLIELSNTIRTHGLIQPIIVRTKEDRYELIAGERRLRASKLAGLETIAVIIRDVSDTLSASIALIENLQREELTSIEEAMSYVQLIELLNLTQESLAQRLSKSQSSIANKIRLLQLCDEVKESICERKITERHGRSLLLIQDRDQQIKLLNDIIENELTVKQLDARIKFILDHSKIKRQGKKRSLAKDVRIAINTINQSIQMIESSGLEINKQESESDTHVEIHIRIPKRRSITI
jgi:ParB family chromosome partitioning protein